MPAANLSFDSDGRVRCIYCGVFLWECPTCHDWQCACAHPNSVGVSRKETRLWPKQHYTKNYETYVPFTHLGGKK